METTATILGAKQLQTLLDQLPDRVSKKGLRQALTNAATPIVKATKQNLPRDSGILKKNITKKVKTYGNGTVAVIIGAKKGVKEVYKGRVRIPSRYFHLVEKGTAHQKGRHALEQAYASNISNAIAIASNKLKEVVEDEAKKMGVL